MLYSVLKSRIEGLLSFEPAHVVAHVGATLQAGREEGREGDAPASREPSTLRGREAGRCGVGRDTADRPGAVLLAQPPVWGGWAGSREEYRSALWGETSYHEEGWLRTEYWGKVGCVMCTGGSLAAYYTVYIYIYTYKKRNTRKTAT
jgi:hypothetical protein